MHYYFWTTFAYHSPHLESAGTGFSVHTSLNRMQWAYRMDGYPPTPSRYCFSIFPYSSHLLTHTYVLEVSTVFLFRDFERGWRWWRSGKSFAFFKSSTFQVTASATQWNRTWERDCVKKPNSLLYLTARNLIGSLLVWWWHVRNTHR